MIFRYTNKKTAITSTSALCDKLRVYHVGPAPSVCGGITTLIESIQANLPPAVEFSLIATHSRYRSSYQDKRFRLHMLEQTAVYGRAVSQVIAARLRSKKKIFHVHLSQQGSALRKGIICILLRISRACYIVHTHAAEDKMFHSWVPWGVRRAMMWGLRGCHQCLVLNDFWADYYSARLSISRERITILPNPADLPAAVPDRSGHAVFTILFLGRLGERKGTYDLIRAFAALPEDSKSRMQLVLAGDGEIAECEQLVRETRCTEHVRITGWVGRSQVRDLLMQADLFVLPSYAEGMAISVLEGLAWGLPVVTTAACGSTSYLEDHRNCLLVKPGDIDALREAILRVYGNTALRAELGSEARKTAESLSIEKYVRKLTHIYCQAAGPLPEDICRAEQTASAWNLK
jgi:glycosyltransferase involved in cell wall biosynthesis